MGGSSQIMELVEENARLKAENERVLSDNKLLIVKLNVEHIVRQNVEADNTKLRELVRISIEHCNSGCCDECPIQTAEGACTFVELARELRVEMDG